MGNQGCCTSVGDAQSFRNYCMEMVTPSYKQYLQKTESLRNLENGKQIDNIILGNWNEGSIMTGSGIIYVCQKIYYEGDIVDGVAQGQGRIVWPGRIYYKGQVKNNCAWGQGELSIDDRSMMIKGTWQNGYPRLNEKMSMVRNNSLGTIAFLNDSDQIQTAQEYFKQKINVFIDFGQGMIYEGELSNKDKLGNKDNHYQMTGKGTLKFKDGSYYTGDFLKGKMHGIGKYVWADTVHWYQGQYNSNFRNGKGRFYYSDTEFEEGEWYGGGLAQIQSETKEQVSKAQIKASFPDDQQDFSNVQMGKMS